MSEMQRGCSSRTILHLGCQAGTSLWDTWIRCSKTINRVISWVLEQKYSESTKITPNSKTSPTFLKYFIILFITKLHLIIKKMCNVEVDRTITPNPTILAKKVHILMDFSQLAFRSIQKLYEDLYLLFLIWYHLEGKIGNRHELPASQRVQIKLKDEFLPTAPGKLLSNKRRTFLEFCAGPGRRLSLWSG